jgi:predicted Rdx family selenoprotein
MNARRLAPLALAALLVAAAAVWVSSRNRPERASPSNSPLLASLAESIDAVGEVRLSRGDGTVTTLQRRDNTWFVAQRNYPANVGQLRSLLINLSALHAVEEKTKDATRYAQLDVDDPTGPQSRSTRIDITAGQRTWSLLLGKAAGPRGSFVRIPGGAAALLAQPLIQTEAQPARWLRTEVLDVAADHVQQVAVHPSEGPAYTIARDTRGATDLTLHGIPPGRKPAAAVVDAVAAALVHLNAQDVKERAAGALEHPSRASFRTFEGLVLDLDGYRDGDTAWIRISASADQDVARRFAPPETKGTQSQGTETKGAETMGAQTKASQTQPTDPASEAAAINARLGGHDFQIAGYQYDAIYRQLKDLLAPMPDQAMTAGTKDAK